MSFFMFPLGEIMTVKLPEKSKDQEILDDPKDPKNPVEGEETLPPETEPAETAEPQEPTAAEKSHKLELELAEARGKLSVLNQNQPSSQKSNPQEEQYLRTKSVVFSDMGALDEESFQKKYGATKSDIKIHYVEYERNIESQKMNEKVSKMEAESEILAKYPTSYPKYKAQIQEAIDDAAPEVRKDPARLAKFIERTYWALSRDEKKEPQAPRTKSKDGEPMRRPIVNDFDAPNPTSSESKDRNREKNDNLEGEDLEIGRHFGMTTKSEREKYSSRNLEMNFGGGVVLRDAKKGFEKISK
jgi:hypothetical protein